jgi:2,3-dihydroxybenzoate-AMP ligase
VRGEEPLDGVVPYPPEFAERYRALGYWRDRTMDQVFGELFDTHADRVALLHADEVITYAQLAQRRATLAAQLHEMGLRRRDRVLMHLPNAPEFLYLYFALQMIGVIPVLALAPHRRLEIEHFARLTEAVAYFGTDEELGRTVQSSNPALRHVVLMDALRPSDEVAVPPPVEVNPSDPCCLLLSGGTTGIPKLIPRTHNDYVYNSEAAAAVGYIAAESCQLSVAPLAHNMPLACPGVQGFLMHGARVVLSEGTRAGEVLPLVARHRVSHIAAVPALYAVLRRQGPPGGGADGDGGHPCIGR